jgi:ribosomal protein S10
LRTIDQVCPTPIEASTTTHASENHTDVYKNQWHRLTFRTLIGIVRRPMDAASQAMHCHAANGARLVAMRVLNSAAITLIE